MKPSIFLRNCFFLSVCFIYAASCSKSSASKNNSSSINGAWQTSVWGGANDTADITISTAAGTGTMIYLSAGATATGFSVNEMIFANIASSANGTFTAVGEYRYGQGGQNVGHANATLTLQSNNTVLYVHYVEDAGTGITPPDYYWQRK
jgi:hypothetical protein